MKFLVVLMCAKLIVAQVYPPGIYYSSPILQSGASDNVLVNAYQAASFQNGLIGLSNNLIPPSSWRNGFNNLNGQNAINEIRHQASKIRNNFNKPEKSASGRNGLVITIDVCFFIGEDVHNSHVRCDPQWNPYAPRAIQDSNAINNYLSNMTYEANRLMNRYDEYGHESDEFYLRFSGYNHRSDYLTSRYPANIPQDIKNLDDYNRANNFLTCDVNIFMVFNQYYDCDYDATVDGHAHAGTAHGAVCESYKGDGYAAVVDQGYDDNQDWIGPKVLAHHLFLLLTTDLYDANYKVNSQVCTSPTYSKRNCDEWYSLLHDRIYPGQYRDECLKNKLDTSCVIRRDCLLYDN